MLRKVLFLTVVAAMIGCRRDSDRKAIADPTPPPAAALVRRGTTLDQSLQELEKQLSDAIETGIDRSGVRHILRAEAITDRLPESHLPFTWLNRPGYRLDAYVRQIQAMADRLVAEIRSGTDRGTVMRDAMELRQRTINLRRALALGGGNPPPALDSLLAAYPADSAIITEEHGE